MNIVSGVKLVKPLEQIRKNVKSSNLTTSLEQIKNLASKLGFAYHTMGNQSLKGNHLTKVSAIKQITGISINRVRTVKGVNRLINVLERGMVERICYEIGGLPSCVCAYSVEYKGFTKRDGRKYPIKYYLNSLVLLAKHVSSLKKRDKELIKTLVNNRKYLPLLQSNIIIGDKLAGYWGVIANLIIDNSLPQTRKIAKLYKRYEIKIMKDGQNNSSILEILMQLSNELKKFSGFFAHSCVNTLKYDSDYYYGEYGDGLSKHHAELLIEQDYSLYLCNAGILSSGNGSLRQFKPLTMFMSWQRAIKLFNGKAKSDVKPVDVGIGTIYEPK